MKIELNEKEVKFLGKLIEGMIDRDYDEGLFEKDELKLLNDVLVKVGGEGFDVKYWE